MVERATASVDHGHAKDLVASAIWGCGEAHALADCADGWCAEVGAAASGPALQHLDVVAPGGRYEGPLLAP